MTVVIDNEKCRLFTINLYRGLLVQSVHRIRKSVHSEGNSSEAYALAIHSVLLNFTL